ncbi:hypothetical protein M9H77_16930 [Catharanthus roseus]|uniref:Uncharacterized protein n=1 Tax=Catharanthus roseus TaxID=4058 RepID=A0ACC0B355_CATRO|nr:hypothetical protein M9H77_16930 [Catharanthus roseus]
MLGRYTLDLDPVDKRRSTVRGLGPRRPVLRGAQVPYPAAVNLAEGKMSRPHSPSHENKAMSENSHHGPTDTAREVSHYSEPTNHEIIGNFMTKMTELLEAILANGR